jgi:hypothetical protein
MIYGPFLAIELLIKLTKLVYGFVASIYLYQTFFFFNRYTIWYSTARDQESPSQGCCMFRDTCD